MLHNKLIFISAHVKQWCISLAQNYKGNRFVILRFDIIFFHTDKQFPFLVSNILFIFSLEQIIENNKGTLK